MSFSSEVKNELARVAESETCCQASELSALIRMGGKVVIGSSASLGLGFSSENAAVARKILSFIKKNFNLKTEVMITRGRRLNKNNTYHVRFVPKPEAQSEVQNLLNWLDIMRDGSINVRPSSTIRKICCRRSFLRGAFLGGGSVNNPYGAYHLEMVTQNQSFANILVKLMRTFRLPAGFTERKNAYIVYLKEGDAITSFLQIIGAHNALMDFENVRIVKDMKNQVNRLVNCETANLGKTAGAAVKQIESIKYIDSTLGLDSLSPELKEVAAARLLNPEATYSELAQMLNHKISKSGVNHRLRKLMEIAEQTREDMAR